MKDWRFLYIMTIGIEGCWLYILMALLNQQVAEGRLSIIGFLLLYPAALGVNWLLNRQRLKEILRRIISWVVWAGAALVMLKFQLYGDLSWADSLRSIPESLAYLLYGFRPELLVLLMSGVLWWLGWRLARLRLNFAMMVSEFQFGLIVLLVIFFAGSQLNANITSSVPATVAFFSFSLLGISIAHAREGTSWLSGLHGRHWSMLLLISIGLVIGVGLLINLVVNPGFLQVILDGLKWLWDLIIKGITFLLSLLPKPGPADVPVPSLMPNGEPSPTTYSFFEIPESVSTALRIFWIVLMVGLLVLALWRISSQIFAWLRRLSGTSGAEIEPMPGAFKSDFLSLLKRLLRNLFGLITFRFHRKAMPVHPEIASVRQIYRQLLRWAAAHGYPRTLSQTPHEYLDVLAGLLPEMETDLSFITHQYVKVRYSPTRPGEGELNRLRQSWQNIKHSGRKKSNRRASG